MAKSFVLADESLVDRGFRLLVSGANLKRFKANPVMLWMHKRERRWSDRENLVMPIGTWENIRIENSKLMADPVFDEDDPVAMAVKSKVEKKIIKGASPGINIIAWSEDPKKMIKGQTLPTITEWEVLEASIVDIPSNPNALQMAAELPDETERLAEESFIYTELSFAPGVEQFDLTNTEDMFNKKNKKDKKSLKSVIAEHLGIKPEEVTQEQITEALSGEGDSSETPENTQEKSPDAEKLQADLDQANADKTQLEADLTTKDQEIENLTTQVANLKGAPAAPKKEVSKETDTPEENLERNDLMSHYSAAQETMSALEDVD